MLFKLIAHVARAKPGKPLQIPFKKWKIVRGDTVIIRSGSEKKKVGKVLKVYRKSNRVVVDGVNVRQKTIKNPDETTTKKAVSNSIHVSKVALLDPQKKVATRVFIAFDETTSQKIRISKKSNSIIPKPKFQQLQKVKRGKNKVDGKKDTNGVKVLQVTYTGQDLESIKKQFEAFIAEKERRQKYLIFN